MAGSLDIYEGEPYVRIIAKLDSPAPADIEITLDNGQVITILTGNTEGFVDVQNPNTEDAYKDGGNFEIKVTEVSGNVQIENESIIVNVKDTQDVTTLSLDVPKLVIGETATITVKLDNPPFEGRPFILDIDDSQGGYHTVTITYPDTEATFEFTPNSEEPVEFDLDDWNTHNYEIFSKDIDNQTYEVFPATLDPITVSLEVTTVDGESIITEVDANVRITATIDTIAPEDIIITFEGSGSTKYTITIPAGSTEGFVDTRNKLAGYDVFSDAGSMVHKVTASGYENLVIPENVRITVYDEINPTKISLDVPELTEGETATITVKVPTSPHGSDPLLTLTIEDSQGETHTVTISSTRKEGTFEFTPNSSEPVSFKVLSATGGRYEQLDYSEVDDITYEVSSDIPSISSTVTLDVPELKEGEEVTITVKVDNPSSADLILNISDSQGGEHNVTIKAGETQGSFSLTPIDDAYLNQEMSFEVTNVSGGNYENLDTSKITDEMYFVEPEDTQTVITLTTSSQTITEGEEVTITASVENAPQTDLVIYLSNGKTITIKENENSGHITYIPLVDDAYRQESKMEDIFIESTTGGNYEDLDSFATTTLSINDDSDTTTISLDVPKLVVGEIAIIKVLVDNPPQEGTPLTLTIKDSQDEEHTITITYPNTEATFEFTPTSTESIKFEVISSNGGNFENLDTTTISDTTYEVTPYEPIVTTVRLTDISGLEGDNFTITFRIDTAPQEQDVIVTLSNGQVIVIPVGETMVQVPFDNNVRPDDVYRQQDSVVKITSVTGGHFDEIKIRETADIKVRDDSDKTKVSLEVPELNEGETATIKVKVDNPPQEGVPLTLTIKDSQGEEHTVTFTHPETQATFEFTPNSSESVTFEALTPHYTANGNYEWLIVAEVDDTTYEVSPSIPLQITKITLEGCKVEEGKDITITAKADSIAKEDLTITLNNGQSIIILAGSDVGTVTYSSQEYDDAYYIAGRTWNISIKNLEGENENYEDVDISSKTKVSLTDDRDATNVSLDVPNLVLGETATITVKVDTPPRDIFTLVIKDSQGDTHKVTINPSQSEATFEFPPKDLSKVSFKVGNLATVYNGKEVVYYYAKDLDRVDDVDGGYENINVSAVENIAYEVLPISEDPIIGKITLISGSALEGLEFEMTVKVDIAPQKEDLKIILSSGQIVTIPVGETEVKVLFSNDDRVDDIYKQGFTNQGVAITQATGGHYDDIDISSTANISTRDDSDVTILTLEVPELVIGETAIITVKVDNPPQEGAPLTFTIFDNYGKGGAERIVTITYPDTQTTFEYTPSSDSVKFETYHYSSSMGGNYENLDMTKISEISYEVAPSIPVTNDPIASNDTITINENTTYTLTISDFGNMQNVEIVKITSMPNNGKLYFNGYHEIGVNSNFTIEVLEAGLITFVPKQNSDEDSSFKFVVGSANGNFEDTEYTVTVNIEAAADKLVATSETNNENIVLQSETEISSENLEDTTVSITSTEISSSQIVEMDMVLENLASSMNNPLSSSINFSNLENEIEDGKLELKNEAFDNLMISLEDIMNINTNNNNITISDEINSISSKDTLNDIAQNNWSKLDGATMDNNYDIYTNGSEEYLQVKVEQPLSDGITH